MIISNEEIKNYLNNIPPIPQHLKNSLKFLKEGNIQKAAIEADKDLVLKHKIKSIINSAYFSLQKQVDDTLQIFTLLGLEMSINILYAHLVSLLSPKEWKFFNINFEDFQAEFLNLYEKWVIDEFNQDVYKKYYELGALIPISVAVAENILQDKKEKIDIILSNTPLEIGTLFKRLTNISLFELASKIAIIWEIDSEKAQILKESECIKCSNKLSALIHTLFFYIVSKPQFFELNSFIEFNPKSLDLIPKTKERILNEHK